MRLLLDEGFRRVLALGRQLLLDVLLQVTQRFSAQEPLELAQTLAVAVWFRHGQHDSVLGLLEAYLRVVRQVQEVG